MTTLSADERRRIHAELMKLPGKKGIDIPADLHDRIRDVATGITMPLWGRPPTPQQMQWLHDQGAHEPAQIHAAFASLPHPHAPSLSVGDYQKYASALKTYKQHSHR